MMRKYPDIVKELERIRRRGFATGGSDTPIAVSASSNMSDEQVAQLTLKSLVDLVNGINAAFKEIQKFGDALGALVEPLGICCQISTEASLLARL